MSGFRLVPGAVALIMSVLTACHQRPVSVEAVVFYRVFNLPTAEGHCRVNIAVPVDAGIFDAPHRPEDAQLVIPTQAHKQPFLQSHSTMNEPAGLMISGRILTIRAGRAFFEPDFSPLELSGDECPNVEMESGKVKYLRLQLVPADPGDQVTILSTRLSHEEDGEPFFMK